MPLYVQYFLLCSIISSQMCQIFVRVSVLIQKLGHACICAISLCLFFALCLVILSATSTALTKESGLKSHFCLIIHLYQHMHITNIKLISVMCVY